MSLVYKKIKNNTNNSLIVNGTYIGPLSETIMNSDVIDLIDQQYFAAGILMDLGETDIDNGVLVIDTQTIQFYKKPALGIPKSHLDKEVQNDLARASKSLLKGQVGLEDLSKTLQNIIKSGATDINGDGINDNNVGTMPNYPGFHSVVIKEKQLEKPIRESLSLARNAYQKPEKGVLMEDLSPEVRFAIENKLGDGSKSWRDPVEFEDMLPTSNNNHGDVILVTSNMSLWVWDRDSEKWVQLNLNDSSNDDDTIIQNPLITKTVVGEFFADAGQTSFVLDKPYFTGTNQLEVYLNGLLVTKGEDYNEIDEYTIEFTYELQEDDYVLTSINSGYSGAVHNVENIVIKKDSDKRIIYSTHAFDPNGQTLRVFLNGILVECGENGDYIEIDSNHIKFNYDLFEEDRVVLRVEGSTVSENILNQFATFRKIYSSLSKQMDVLQHKVDQLSN